MLAIFEDDRRENGGLPPRRFAVRPKSPWPASAMLESGPHFLAPKRFQVKWKPVHRRETRNTKNLEPFCISIETKTAPASWSKAIWVSDTGKR